MQGGNPMKKKMRKHLFKKSFVTLLAVSVLSTSISITAFAEEENTSEEPAVVAEVAPAEDPTITTETTYTAVSDTAGENPYGADLPIINGEDLEDAPGSEPSDNVVWWYELEDYIEETDKAEEVPVENTKETNPEYPYTIHIRYAYTSDDGASYSDISASQLAGATTSVKSTEWGFFESPVSIPSMGKGYSFAGLIIEGIMYSISFDSFDMVFDNYVYDGKVITVVYNYTAPQQKNPDYPYTIHFRYAYTTDIYDTENLKPLSADQLVGTVSSANANAWGLFENTVSIKTDMGEGFSYAGMLLEGIYYPDALAQFWSVSDGYIYDNKEITVLYLQTINEEPENEVPTNPVEQPTEDPTETVVPAEPEKDTVVPTEPVVDTAAPTEEVAPAPAEPVVPVVPALVESAPIVVETGTFPPMVEEVDAPAFVFPTLLEAAGEIMELIPDEELPLANIELKKTETPMGHIHMDPHLCNILSLLLLLAVAFVVYSYIQMAKKHEERIYELKLGYRY